MKKQSALSIVTLSLMCLLNLTLQGCTHFQQKSYKQPTLIGSWKLKNPGTNTQTFLTFREDQTFEVDVGGDDTVDIRGTYDLFGTRIKLSDVGSSGPSICLHSGFYDYRLGERTLEFYLFADECVDRKEILKMEWKSIPMVPKQ